MFITKLESGKVRYNEKYKDPITNQRKRVSVVFDKDTSKNRREALAILTDKIEKACSYSSDNSITLKTLLDSYVDYQEKTVKKSTYERNKSTLTKLVNIIGPNVIVNNLTVMFLNQKLLSLDCSNVTRNEYIRRLKAMLNWGKKMDLHNNYKICENMVPFKEDVSKKERIQDKFLEPEDASALLTYMEDNNSWMWYHITKILILSGLRIGELLALTNEDVTDTTIHVSKTLDLVNRIVTTPKTFTSNRDVFIQKELSTAIKTYKLWSKEYKFSHGINTNLLFYDKNGDYVQYASYSKYIREASEHVLGRRITPHAFRHTNTSLLTAAGVPIETISRRLGHENSRITRDIYTHVTKTVIEADQEAVRDVKIL